MVIVVRKTDVFADWLDRLRDLQGRARIQARIERMAAGNAGDVAPVGQGFAKKTIQLALAMAKEIQ